MDQNFSYSIDAGAVRGENDRFWAACGTDSLYPQLFTEAGEALLKRGREQGTIRWLRNHHTLSSLAKDGYAKAGGEVYTEDENGNPVYNFAHINRILSRYLEEGVKPVLELDYLPDALSRGAQSGGEEEGVFCNRSYPNDWDKWQELLRAFMRNLADTFGIEELRSWYFEVWNEADGWPVEDWPMFHRLYDVFADAVLGVDAQLRIGGPGSFRQDFLRAFLEHVANGVNYVTGERGTRLDFISHHIYGMSGSWLGEYPLIMPTVQRYTQELMWLSRMIGVYPALRDAEFHLNEWGVCSHYEARAAEYPALEIRNSEFSACFFVKLVDCIQQLRLHYGFRVALMLYWGFCLEDNRGEIFAGNRDLMTYPHLPKPILTVMEMMARMGDTLLQAEGTHPGGQLGCLAARESRDGSVQFMNYYFDENEAQERAAEGTVRICGLADGAYLVRRMVLDIETHNTYRLWERLGRPEKPEGEVLEALQAAAALDWDSEEILECRNGELALSVHLKPQSIALTRLEKMEKV